MQRLPVRSKGSAMSTDTPTESQGVNLLSCHSPFETGMCLLALELWPVPIRNGEKRPRGRAWGARRNTAHNWIEHYRRFPGDGVGICLGPGRGPGGGWLIDIEGDGPEAEDSRATLFGGELVETLSWG